MSMTDEEIDNVVGDWFAGTGLFRGFKVFLRKHGLKIVQER